MKIPKSWTRRPILFWGVLVLVFLLILFLVPVAPCGDCKYGPGPEPWDGIAPITGVRWIDRLLSGITPGRGYGHVPGREGCPYCKGTGDLTDVEFLSSCLRLHGRGD
jgi:hypothetical protein